MAAITQCIGITGEFAGARHILRGLALPVVTGFAVCLSSAAPAGAQSAHGATLDVTVGPSSAWSSANVYRASRTPAAALTFVAEHRSARLLAVSVGVRPQFAEAMVCRLTPDGSCGELFPAMAYAGVLGGLEGSVSAVGFRALLGPAYFVTDRPGAGGQLLLDAATGYRHVAFVVAARGSYLLRSGGERMALGSGEVGIRLR